MQKLRLFWSSIWKLIWQFRKRSTAPLNLAALDGRFPLTNPEAQVHFISFEHNPSEDQNVLKASSSTLSIHSFLAKELGCLHGLTFSECTMRKMTWSIISWARPVSAVGILTFSEVAIHKWMPSAVLLQGPLLILSTTGLCFWLNHFNLTWCSRTLWPSTQVRATLSIPLTKFLGQWRQTQLGFRIIKKTTSFNPRAAFPSYLPGWYPNRTLNKWNMGSSVNPQHLQKLETDFIVLSVSFPCCFSLVLFSSDFFLFAMLVANWSKKDIKEDNTGEICYGMWDGQCKNAVREHVSKSHKYPGNWLNANEPLKTNLRTHE